jgi:uncharacterized membrane protein
VYDPPNCREVENPGKLIICLIVVRLHALLPFSGQAALAADPIRVGMALRAGPKMSGKSFPRVAATFGTGYSTRTWPGGRQYGPPRRAIPYLDYTHVSLDR